MQGMGFLSKAVSTVSAAAADVANEVKSGVSGACVTVLVSVLGLASVLVSVIVLVNANEVKTGVSGATNAVSGAAFGVWRSRV